MKLENSYFKKELVLLFKSLLIFQEKVKKLMKIIYEFFKMVYVEDDFLYGKYKKYFCVKYKFFYK